MGGDPATWESLRQPLIFIAPTEEGPELRRYALLGNMYRPDHALTDPDNSHCAGTLRMKR